MQKTVLMSGVTSSAKGTEGGRFDFNDGGSYVGEWADGRAHGLGIATGPEDNPGEYAGEWILGFESLGVYVWPSGSIYEGRWMKGKRHGEGMQTQGRWKYKGEFTTGFCGRYGVRESVSSCAKYEGSWNLNQFDGFGIETNSDGSTYAGGWTKGLRSGLGVRKSVPYGLAADFRTGGHVRATASQSSIPTGVNEPDITTSGMAGTDPMARRLDEHRNGFVLIGQASSHMSHHHKKGFLEKSSDLFRKGIFRKLRKQKSTGDLHNSSSMRTGRGGGSLRSTVSTSSQMTNHSMPLHGTGSHHLDVLSSPDSPHYNATTAGAAALEMIINPNATESYTGQWLEDKRTGYGIAERSDGLRYEGEWLNNKKNGYGCTHFPDGTKEEGRYRNNILVSALNRKNKLLLLRNSRMRDCVDAAVNKAQQLSKDAITKAQESANQRAQTARMAAASAEKAAKEARRACELARAIAYEFAPDFVQPGHQWERNRATGGESGSGGLISLNTRFAGANQPGGNTQPYHHMSSALRSKRQQQMSSHDDNMMGEPNNGECLEVSGGSRRGSFRSSFRRNRDGGGTGGGGGGSGGGGGLGGMGNDASHGAFGGGMQSTNVQVHGGSSAAHPYGIGRSGTNAKPSMSVQNDMEERIVTSKGAHSQAAMPGGGGGGGGGAQQQSHNNSQPAGGASKLQRQQQQRFANNSQSSKMPSSSLSPSSVGQQQHAAPPHSSQYNADGSSQTNSNTIVSIGDMSGSTVLSDHFDQYGQGRRNVGASGGPSWHQTPAYKRDSGLGRDSSLEDPPGYNSAYGSSGTGPLSSPPDHRWACDTPDSGMSDCISPLYRDARKERRRTLPSIMTTKPVTPLSVAAATSAANNKAKATTATSPNTYNEIAHSEDALYEADKTTFIIENGIRKRVQAETMRRTNQMDRNIHHDGPSSIKVEADELAPLPRLYLIQSQKKLCKDLGEGSLPDVSFCRQIQMEGGIMSRDEVSQLSQAQRQKRLLEEERRKRGEIVIRIADVKDWTKNNVWVLLLLAINAVLAFAFLSLLRDSRSFTDDGPS